MQERGADLGRESMGQVIREHSLMESEDLRHKNEVRHHCPWCFLITSLCTTRIAYCVMYGKYTILGSLCDWYQGASSKGVFEVSVERQQEVFSLALSLGSWFASFD